MFKDKKEMCVCVCVSREGVQYLAMFNTFVPLNYNVMELLISFTQKISNFNIKKCTHGI